jgi:hypothetical protein
MLSILFMARGSSRSMLSMLFHVKRYFIKKYFQLYEIGIDRKVILGYNMDNSYK